MASFKNFIPPKCTVIRDGVENQILALDIVPGDKVKIKDGDRVPADVRLIECKEMTVDNSSLTGESDPLLRSNKQDEEMNILTAKNVAFFGTLCKSGDGVGIVFSIGDNTVIGQIAGLADTAEAGISPLRRELDLFIKMITVIALVLGIVLFLCAKVILQYSFITCLVFAIGIIVANVPEGLLATITITLAVAARTLSTKKVLVKNLESVETLGSTSCICSDKTGTLTQNKMTIANLFYNLKIVKADNYEKLGPKFNYQYKKESEMFRALQESAVVNTKAIFIRDYNERTQNQINNLDKSAKDYQQKLKKIDDDWQQELDKMPFYDKPVLGDASETAIVKFFQGIEDIIQIRDRFP